MISWAIPVNIGFGESNCVLGGSISFVRIVGLTDGSLPMYFQSHRSGAQPIKKMSSRVAEEVGFIVELSCDDS